MPAAWQPPQATTLLCAGTSSDLHAAGRPGRTAGGQDDAPQAVLRQALDALEDGAVLAVCGQDADAVLRGQGQHVGAPCDEGLLVGQADVLACLDRRDRRLQACAAAAVTPAAAPARIPCTRLPRASFGSIVWTCACMPPRQTADDDCACVQLPRLPIWPSTARSPAQPTMPVMTASASGCTATSHMPCMPATSSGCGCTSLIISLSASILSPDLQQRAQVGRSQALACIQAMRMRRTCSAAAIGRLLAQASTAARHRHRHSDDRGCVQAAGSPLDGHKLGLDGPDLLRQQLQVGPGRQRDHLKAV